MVGKAIEDSKIRREDIFVSTKIWPSEYEDKDIVDKTLKRMNLEYIDLLFLHQLTKNWKAGYKTLIKAYKEGEIKAIGVSNFEDEFIKELIHEFDILPQVMQVECHPSYSQKELRNLIDPLNIHLMSWYPLGGKGNDSLLNNETVKEIAGKYHRSVATIILAWHLQMGFMAIPGSKNKEHIKENFSSVNIELSIEDMNTICSLDQGKRFYIRDSEALERFGTLKPSYEG